MTELARKLDGLLECFAKEIEAFRNGGSNLRAKHLREAQEAGLDAGAVANLLAEWDDAIAKQKVPVEWLQWFKKPRPRPKPETQQKAETDKGPSETGAAQNVFDKLKSKSGEIKFHKSDLKPEVKPPTIEEKEKALEELADLRKADPIAYGEKRKDWAKRLFTTVAAIEQAVKIVLEKRADDSDQSQATKLVAVGMGNDVRRWHSPNGDGFASVLVGGHWENYRIDSTLFHRWLLHQYGQQHTAKVGDKWVPQVPASGAIRDAIAQLGGIARFQGEEHQPAYRVGGTREEIWIDLGGEQWRTVQVTVEGWRVRDTPEVAFIRTGSMLPLPVPVGGGSIKALERVLNVHPSEFVLVVGWLLQALNPVGPYPQINACGASEHGKSTTSKMLLRTIDPNLTQLRRPSRKVEDLLIAARNGWTVGLDNVSWMTLEMSDTLCMIATGISSGTRAHYTNDEEHAYTVMRPVLFNGIPSELTERGDLASRIIKLQIPAIITRRTEAALEEEFVEIWPEVLGALLDGIAAGLRNAHTIDVLKDRGQEPARLMDFERFAEAGCRALGFREWEFVDAYAANRKQTLIVSLEGSAVGRAALQYMNSKTGKDKGFAGKMSDLLITLSKYDSGSRDWPKDATRLSSGLDRIIQPLRAVGIDCLLRVDRRKEGGSQWDVILRWHK